jgi:N-acyl-D-amino-acid deacylase
MSEQENIMRRVALFICTVLFLSSVCVFDCFGAYDVIIKSGRVYDGSGGPAYVADVAIEDDRIAAIGRLDADANLVIDASGLAVAPGFINMLSWATDTLIEDGRSQSDIRQGVTLEVMGEGFSMGPLNETMKRDMLESQGDIKFNVEWTTLGEYLEYLERKGVSTNVASFVGASTVRIHALGYQDRTPTYIELQKMRQLVAQAMQEGALGVSSALIYAPGVYAKTDELVALADVAGKYGGMYISHLRSEGNELLEAMDELITIAKKANVAAEVYHIKAAGKANWYKLDAMIEKIEKARAEGLKITADMYTYTAGATGLDAAMPPWVQAGGFRAWVARLKDPAIRRRVLREMSTPSDEWENLYLLAGSPENVLLVGFKNESLRHLTGKNLPRLPR